MALTKTVTQLRPRLGPRNIFTVGLHLLIQDGGVTVIDTDVTETYNGTQPIAPIKKNIKDKAQALIDDYKKEKNLQVKQAYVNAIDEIDTELDITE